MKGMVLRPRMMDAGAQSCPDSTDGFHWVSTMDDEAVCLHCERTCAPLPMSSVDESVVDLINARAAERNRTKSRAQIQARLPIPERWMA